MLKKTLNFLTNIKTCVIIHLAAIVFAGVAELADAPDLGSGGQPWGFKSLLPHHTYLIDLIVMRA
jgi:hypothetical protein